MPGASGVGRSRVGPLFPSLNPRAPVNARVAQGTVLQSRPTIALHRDRAPEEPPARAGPVIGREADHVATLSDLRGEVRRFSDSLPELDSLAAGAPRSDAAMQSPVDVNALTFAALATRAPEAAGASRGRA